MESDCLQMLNAETLEQYLEERGREHNAFSGMNTIFVEVSVFCTCVLGDTTSSV